MTERTFRQFPQGVVASFDPIVTGNPDIDGDPIELSSAQNAPAADPESWLSRINFHSEFDYLAVANAGTITLSHTAIGAGTNTGDGVVDSNFEYDTSSFTDWVLCAHGLGYAPVALVALTGKNAYINPGYPIQMPVTSNGAVRFGCPWVDNTNLYLREYRAKGSSGLAAIDITYNWLIFEQQPDASGDKVFEVQKDTGNVNMGFNRWQSTKRYLQIVYGGTPFSLSRGRTMDAKNGAYRIVAADGTTFDPIASTQKTAIKASSEASAIYGPTMQYNGSFAGNIAAQVQAP